MRLILCLAMLVLFSTSTVIAGDVKTINYKEIDATNLHEHLASGQATLESVQEYIENGADVSKKELMDCVGLGLYYISNWRVRKENEGFGELTPMMVASLQYPPDVLQELLDAGADVTTRGFKDQTALHFASKSNSHPEVAQLLINAGANMNAKDTSQNTAIHIASRYNKDSEFIKYLIKAGAVVTKKDSSGYTPLMRCASRFEDITLIQLLLDAGSDINAKERYGYTPLMFSMKKGTTEKTFLLIDSGAKVDFKTKNNKSPLFYALEKRNSIDTISQLLEAGANVNAKNKEGKTALDLAREKGHSARPSFAFQSERRCKGSKESRAFLEFGQCNIAGKRSGVPPKA